jgi:hypothetical protein
MDAATEFGHHLSMGDALLPRRRLSLSNSELLKQFNLGFQSLVVVNAHDHEIAFTIGREVHWLIMVVAKSRNLSGAIAQARD